MAICQAFVVEAHQVQYCGMEIVNGTFATFSKHTSIPSGQAGGVALFEYHAIKAGCATAWPASDKQCLAGRGRDSSLALLLPRLRGSGAAHPLGTLNQCHAHDLLSAGRIGHRDGFYGE